MAGNNRTYVSSKEVFGLRILLFNPVGLLKRRMNVDRKVSNQYGSSKLKESKMSVSKLLLRIRNDSLTK